MKVRACLIGIFFLLLSLRYAAAFGATPEEALTALKEGNERFVSGASEFPHEDAKRREDTADNGQEPFVTILSCSDSRVPPELLFDQGLGDAFIIRVAGNVADTDEIGTIEYGVGHLGTPLLVVLGHTQCGAVTVVCTKAEVHGSISRLLDKISPAVEKAQVAFPGLHGKDLVPEATKANIWKSIEDILKRSEEIRGLVREKKLKVVGAMYDIKTGRVEWLGEHPELTDLLMS